MRRLWVVLAVLVTVVPACGGGGATRRTSSSMAATSTTETSVRHGVSSEDAARLAKEGKIHPPTTRQLTPEEKQRVAEALAKMPKNWISVTIKGAGAPNADSPQTPRLIGCEDLKRGQECRINFIGSYQTDAPTGMVMLASYDDGVMATSVKLPFKLTGYQRWYIDRFYYRVSQTAKQVSFKATLLGPDGQALAESQPLTYDIP